VLWPDLTVSEHLRFFAGVKGVAAADVESAIAAVIKEIGLTEKVNARSKQLSGGQKRKVSTGAQQQEAQRWAG
jgi:ATP-binding cassette, subfamily A (ABC1), member 3